MRRAFRIFVMSLLCVPAGASVGAQEQRSEGGLAGPAATATLEIEPGRTAEVADAVAELFGADGNGAMILSAPEPFAAAAHVFNDQRANPQVGGTFGLFVPALAPEQLLDAGLPLLGSNRRRARARVSAPTSSFSTRIRFRSRSPSRRCRPRGSCSAATRGRSSRT